MDTIEIVATSLDEARALAASQLGVESDQVDVEVIDESKGLFGKPGKLTVKASVKSSKSKAKKPAAKATKAKAEKEEVVEEQPAAEEATASPKAKSKKSTKAESNGKASKSASKSDDDSEKSDAEEVVATQEDADTLLGHLNTLLTSSGLSVDATLQGLNNRYVNISIDGSDVGYLIGKRGEVLNAMQYLMNVIASRHLSNGVRVVLDADHYRERRTESLCAMAENIAQAVIERGEEAVLDALPAFERRVIHQALAEIAGVTTYSEGEEPNRHVVIAPAN
ncbi:RNA-binding cell elongation regulator Jag/EloR [Kamptonema cortianum]|nr:RNA-binding cell elongation regulator Jag/EloR [Geitlerinema splendidum]MDK3160962.1 RNA-binding cell elongation regulator Jag/EloR [Kamptonema cortianum]